MPGSPSYGDVAVALSSGLWSRVLVRPLLSGVVGCISRTCTHRLRRAIHVGISGRTLNLAPRLRRAEAAEIGGQSHTRRPFVAQAQYWLFAGLQHVHG